MVLLQHKLHLRVSQRQILTPGLVQMVSVLALNKLELKDMINAEMVENPVLEELEDAVPLIDDVSRREEELERASAAEETPAPTADKKDPFEEIDFGSFFKDYLDPGYRSQNEMEEIERPSFENFLSKPSTLTDHLMWQLGSISTRPSVREAAEAVIGNLNEDGYLIASDEELLGIAPAASPESDAAKSESVFKEAAALGLTAAEMEEAAADATSTEDWEAAEPPLDLSNDSALVGSNGNASSGVAGTAVAATLTPADLPANSAPTNGTKPVFKANFTRDDLHEAIETVRQLDPPGVPALSIALSPSPAREERKRKRHGPGASQRGCHGGPASPRVAEQAVQGNFPRYRPSRRSRASGTGVHSHSRPPSRLALQQGPAAAD